MARMKPCAFWNRCVKKNELEKFEKTGTIRYSTVKIAKATEEVTVRKMYFSSKTFCGQGTQTVHFSETIETNLVNPIQTPSVNQIETTEQHNTSCAEKIDCLTTLYLGLTKDISSLRREIMKNKKIHKQTLYVLILLILFLTIFCMFMKMQFDNFKPVGM